MLSAVLTPKLRVLILVLASAFATYAQNVLITPPFAPVPPPALQEFRASEEGVPLGEEAPGFTLPAIPLRFGPVTLQPSAAYTITYDHGLLAGPGQPEDTFYQSFTPAFLFVIGSHWTLNYSPSWIWYSSAAFQTELNHRISLNGWAAYEDWTLGLAQDVNISSSPIVETGQQTDEETFSTSLSASHRFSSQVSLDLGLNQTIQSVQQFQGFRQWSTMDWLNYQFWPRLTGGLGLGGGYANVDTGSDMTFQQFQGRISWHPAQRSSFTLHAGGEYRQFLDGGVPPLLSPIFGLAVQYFAGRKTSLALTADHSISVSYFDNQVSQSSNVGLTVSQSLSPKLTLFLGGGVTAVSYVSTAPGIPAAPSYNYKYCNANLTYAVIKHGTLSGTYQFSDNTSSQSQSGLGFTTHQFSLSIGYSF
jgi:hypothetical protein